MARPSINACWRWWAPHRGWTEPRWRVRVSVVAAITTLLGCGGLRIGSVADTPAPSLPTVPVDTPATWHVVADADAVVHSYGKWRGQALGDEDWLMAGTTSGRDAAWLTYLGFDLTAVPSRATLSRAWLDLPPARLDVEQPTLALDVHVVTGSWTEGDVAWSRQPLVARLPSARVLLGGAPDGATGGDVADVTRVLNDALARGDARIGFVIVPAAPEQGVARRWDSREHLDEEAPSMDSAPCLRLVTGPPPPPPSAAEHDLATGGRPDITSR